MCIHFFGGPYIILKHITKSSAFWTESFKLPSTPGRTLVEPGTHISLNSCAKILNHVSVYVAGWYDMIWLDTCVNCNWVSTRWQQYSTLLHTQNTQNDTKQTIYRITQKFWKSAGRARSLRVLPWNLPYNWGKSTEFRSLLVVVPKCPRIIPKVRTSFKLHIV